MRLRASDSLPNRSRQTAHRLDSIDGSLLNRLVAREVIQASSRCEHKSSVPRNNSSSLLTVSDFRWVKLARNSLRCFRVGVSFYVGLAGRNEPEQIVCQPPIGPAPVTGIFFTICRHIVSINCPIGRSTNSGSRRRGGCSNLFLITEAVAADAYSSNIE